MTKTRNLEPEMQRDWRFDADCPKEGRSENRTQREWIRTHRGRVGSEEGPTASEVVTIARPSQNVRGKQAWRGKLKMQRRPHTLRQDAFPQEETENIFRKKRKRFPRQIYPQNIHLPKFKNSSQKGDQQFYIAFLQGHLVGAMIIG